jgi:hypothetical protein
MKRERLARINLSQYKEGDKIKCTCGAWLTCAECAAIAVLKDGLIACPNDCGCEVFKG